MTANSTEDSLPQPKKKASKETKDDKGGTKPKTRHGKKDRSKSPHSPKKVTDACATEKNDTVPTRLSLDARSIKLLQKKIVKTLNLMKEAEENEPKGQDSKLYLRLVDKLHQYELEITALEGASKSIADVNDNPETVSKPDIVKPVAVEKRKPWNQPKTTEGQDVDSKVPKKKKEKWGNFLANTSSDDDDDKCSKIKKVNKKHDGGKGEEYEMALKDLNLESLTDDEDMTVSNGAKWSKPLPTRSKSKMLKRSERQSSRRLVRDELRSSSHSSRKGPRKSKAVSAIRIRELDREFKPNRHTKDNEAKELIRRAIEENFVFDKLSEHSVDALVEAFEPTKVYRPRSLILTQGEQVQPIFFFIIANGEVEFEVDGVKVGKAGPGTGFGEQGLLYSCKRKASVRAVLPTQLFRVDQITYRYLLQNQTKFHTAWKQTMRTIMAMNRLVGAAAVAGKLHESESELCSTAIVSRQSKNRNEKSLDEESGELLTSLNKRRTSVKESLQNASVKLEDFSRQSVLGEGQFGEVWRVQLTSIEALKDRDFALKIQTKEDTEREDTPGMTITVAEAIQRECDVLSQLCHPFICEFLYMFEDDKNIYIVMGIIRGMELWSVVHREGTDGNWISGIPEANARFYCAMIADTLRYMHRQKICYRDLKPENVMVDETGYPVLVDFGFAKHIPSGVTYTFCGTPQYTCPEIIGNQGHGLAVDWWAFGIVIYELITGENPFYYDGIDEMQLFEDILHQDPEPLRAQYSIEVKDLIDQLLNKDPFTRLGTLNPNQVLKHPWLASIDVEKGRMKELEPPFLPPLSQRK